MRRLIKDCTIGFAVCLVFACSDDRSGGAVDPKPALNSSGGQEAPQPSSTPPEATKTDASNPVCLINCSIPDSAQYSFTEKAINFQENCNIKSIEMLDTGSHLLIFHQSDCGIGTQTYVTKSSYDLKAEAAINLTSDCADSGNQVDSFKIVQGDASVLVMAACRGIGTTATVYGTMIDMNGSKKFSKQLIIISVSSGDRVEMGGKWNPTANAFGIIFNESNHTNFQRFSLNLDMIGGTILIGPDLYNTKNALVSEKNGQWFVLYHVPNAVTYCSRVSQLGVLGCNGVSTGGSDHPLFFDGNQLIGISYGPSLRMGSLNPLSCDFEYSNPLAFPAADTFGSAWILNNSYAGIIYKNAHKTYNLAIMNRNPLSIASTIAIMDGDVSLGAPLMANKYIVLPYIRGGLAFIRQSDRQVP